MATYFHGNTEIQAPDGLQTLLLMKPSYAQYSDAPPAPAPANFVFLNSPQNSISSHTLAHALPPHTQQFVGIPLPVSAADNNSQSISINQHHEISALHGFAPRIPYNVWNSIDTNTVARGSPRSQRGLSLSLSSQHPAYGSFRADREIQSQTQPKEISGEDVRISGGSSSSVSVVTNGVSGMQQNVLLSSKYLKAAQELLEEVVNVGNGIQSETSKKSNGQNKVTRESSTAANGDGSTGVGEESRKRAAELSTADKHEIQMKKAKLINMLEEVDRRYRQYHNQMQIVVSSFEQATGIGSAKTYTALALETISKQFRCLKDAITGQIQSANKKLGEEDCLGGKVEGSSRLKFVDHHLRQQRALQQLGMIQHNAWRPQRGLPERSVSVLRAWLFEHFLHPYPKDSDKHMLAKQTGLTRSQVSNWFINARVRLWKPMVEEMYMEEIKQQEQNNSQEKSNSEEQRENSASKSTPKQEKTSVIVNQTKSFKSKQDEEEFPPLISNIRNQSGFSFMGLSEMEGIGQGSPKKLRNIERQSNDGAGGGGGYSMMGGGGGPANFIGGFGQYSMEEIGRFGAESFAPRYSGNGVSLTLGLPHCENNSMGRNHQRFLPNQNIQGSDFGSINGSSEEFESLSIQNSKRFAAQLLPDFVS